MVHRKGFTLTELLVVVGIIVLIVTLAVPAFNAISGNRSIDSAQNQLAAIIGRARQEAIGLGDYRGVIMFQDPNTGRGCAAEVYYPDPIGNPTLLDVTPNHDELLLPPGIGFRMVETTGAAGNNSYYSSMNVILFNSRGQFVSQPWAVLNVTTPPATTPPPTGTTLGLRVQPMPSVSSSWPSGMVAPVLRGSVWVDSYSITAAAFNPSSALGFVLFPDENAFRDQYSQNANTTYLTDNGVTFLINKYNGTLLRSE